MRILEYYDVIEHTKIKQKEDFFKFLHYFNKAFDSFEWPLITKSVKHFQLWNEPQEMGNSILLQHRECSDRQWVFNNLD